MGAISKGWRAENVCIVYQNAYVWVGRVPFRGVGEQEMHVYCIRMAIWGLSDAIAEGLRPGNACILHQNGILGLVGCHFGGSASRKCMYSASEWPFGVGQVPFWRVALAWPVVEGLSGSNC